MRARASLIAFVCALLPTAAFAQWPPQQPQRPGDPVNVTSDEGSRALRKRFGAGMAERLLTSNDDDERLRGIARASADGSPEAIGLLAGLQDVNLRVDPRGMIELARALAPYVDQEAARTRLLALVGAAAGSGGRRGDDPSADDPVAKVELARSTAALAIASSKDSKAIDELVKLTKQSGIGQLAAANALLAYNISPFTAKLENPTSPTNAWLYAESGDLRLLDALLAVAGAPGDLATRQVALRGLAQAGDQRVTEIAKRILGLDDKKSPAEADPKLRVAAAEALTLLDAPARYSAVANLLRDNATLQDGVRLSERVQTACAARPCASGDISTALGKLIATFSDPTFRETVVATLGRGSTDEALNALIALLPDPRLGPSAAQAIARSPHPQAMSAIEKMTDKRLAVRAYVLRRTTRGERSGVMDDLSTNLARSKNARDRALGTFAIVALDPSNLDAGLADPDPHVRRMAAMGARANPSPRILEKLLAALANEKDDATRVVFAGALASGDASSLVPTLTLVDRAEAGGPDAPFAALALAARTRLEDESLRDKVSDLFHSRDPITRAHVARGLGVGPAADASGMLADAYRYETDGKVRRAIVLALASRERDASSPSRTWVLATASQLDPDALVRLIARRALAGLPPSPAAVVHECAWLRVIAPNDAAMPKDLTGSYVGADGVAVPFAFDEDGFALVLSVTPGEGRLVLAPRVP